MTRAHSRSLIGVAPVASLVLGLAACATESHQAVEVEKPAAASIAYSGPRSAIAVGKFDNRSEEHTSELQSQSNLVCRLLLEKKNRTTLHRTHALSGAST